MQAKAYDLPGWGRPSLGRAAFTAADVVRLPDDEFRYEVYRGVLIRMPGNGDEHGVICQTISVLLSADW